VIKGLYRVVFLLAFISCNQHSSELKDNHKTEGRYYRYFDPFLFRPKKELSQSKQSYPCFEIINDTNGLLIGFNVLYEYFELFNDLKKSNELEKTYGLKKDCWIFKKTDFGKMSTYEEAGHGVRVNTIFFNGSVFVQRNNLYIQDAKPLTNFLHYFYGDSMITYYCKSFYMEESKVDFNTPIFDSSYIDRVITHYFTENNGILEIRTKVRTTKKLTTYKNYLPAEKYDPFTFFLINEFPYNYYH